MERFNRDLTLINRRNVILTNNEHECIMQLLKGIGLYEDDAITKNLFVHNIRKDDLRRAITKLKNASRA